MQTNTQPGTTAAHDFFSCNSASESLFSVRPGVSAVNALEQVSVLLDAALSSARDAVNSCSDNSACSATYLIEMAAAVIDSLLIVRSLKQDDARGFLDRASHQVNGGAQ